MLSSPRYPVVMAILGRNRRRWSLVFCVLLTLAHTASAQCGCCDGTACGYRQFCVDDCHCEYASPIIVDTTGEGFHLTSAPDGVAFDIAGDGHPLKLAWTAATSRNAFLALDRDHDGKIDSGKELFGNVTEQPKSDDPNGFLALAEFDKPENGGNGDGIIDSRDSVFSQLRLWIDENHDGISQPHELHTLSELGVFSIGLQYRDEHFSDEFGNWFRYRAALNPDSGDGRSKDGRWTYDVYFVPDQSATVKLRNRSLIYSAVSLDQRLK
jgi:hypothetical protein